MTDVQPARSQAASCNLATNGSFESPNIQTDPEGPGDRTQLLNGYAAYRTGTTPINGWETVSGTRDILRNYTSTDGAQSIDLYGVSAATLRQTFTNLVPGRQYRFSIDYTGLSAAQSAGIIQLGNGRGVTPVTLSTLRPAADAIANPTTNFPTTPAYTATWSTFQHTFTAAGTEATIQITNTGVFSTSGTGLFIDNFSFSSVDPCEADLTITKDDGVTTYTPGLDTNYTIVVTNNGPAPVIGARITDPLPTGITQASWTCGAATGGGVCGATSGTGAINTTANLPVGASVTYKLGIGIPGSYSGSLTNTATVTAPAGVTDTDTSNNTASDSDAMELPPVSGACSPRLVGAGLSFNLAPLPGTGTVARSGTAADWGANPWTKLGGNYTITWTFAQPIPASWLRFGIDNVADISTGATFTIGLSGGGTATVGQMAVLSGHFTHNGAGVIRRGAANGAQVNGVFGFNSTGTIKALTITASGVPTSDHIHNPLWVVPSCLTLQKVSQDGTGAFRINMGNVVQANGAAVSSATLTTTTAGTPVSSAAYNAVPGRDVTLSEVVPAGWNLASAVCTDRNAGATGNPTVVGSLASPMLTIPAANVRPQSDIQCLFTNANGADLSITKDDGAATYAPGANVVYNIVVTNNGPAPVTGARITDALPAGITRANWICGTSTGGAACGAPSGTGGIDTTADLPVGGSLTYALTMEVPVDFTGDLVNTASIATPDGVTDTDPSNNTATDTDKVSEAKVSVKKELIGESVTANNVAEPGEVLTYKVTITHTEGGPFTDFDFIENIPNGATMTRVEGANGFTTPVAGASTVQLTVPQVPVGGTAEVEIDLTVAAPIPLGISQIRNLVSGGDVPADCANCSVSTPTPPYSPVSPPTISCSTTGAYFNTAFDGRSGMKASGSDDYWQVATTPANVTGNPPATLSYGAATVVSSPPGNYIKSPFGNANWIAHQANGGHTGNVDAFYRYQFRLDPAVDPKSLALAMSYYSDNSVYQVWVNGVAQNIRSNYGADPYFYAGFAANGVARGTLNKNWTTGLNTIVVQVKSGPGAQAFMAQINSGAICQPKITLRKEVVNDNGGTATPADFTLSATGKSPLTNVVQGPMGNSAVTNASIPAGTYTLGEVNQPAYIAGAYSCAVDGGASTVLEKNELTLDNGQNAICTIVNDDQNPKLTIDKTGAFKNDRDGDGFVDAGDTITYTFLVKNTGNVPLTGVTVKDDLLARAGLTVTPGPQTLQPDAEVTFTATYTALQDDIEAGQVTNTATAVGTPPAGDPVESEPDTLVMPPDSMPVVKVKKELIGESITANNVAEPDEVLTYRITLTHESGATFKDFDFIENIPNGATMTRVSGADGFTDPVGGAATVPLRVPEVPAGGTVEVEIDLTVAAPIPLGITQIRNLVSGGDVPADCTNCSVTTPTPPYTPHFPETISCTTPGAFFNTAYNGAGGAKPSGTDTYWQIATNTSHALPANSAYSGATIVAAASRPGGWATSPYSNASWISKSASGGSTGDGDYSAFYSYQFNLDPAVDPSSLGLKMNYYADDDVVEVYVNGAAQGISAKAAYGTNSGASGTLNKNFKTGLNQIVVHTRNSGGGVSGFMAQIEAGNICQPKITLRKQVINDQKGTAVPTDFTLRATGKSPLTKVIQGAMGAPAVTNASIPAGTFTLGEDNQPGYLSSTYSCAIDGGAETILANNELTLINGQNAICTIINNDQAPELKLEKTGKLNDLNGNNLIDLGETITYSFRVENVGDVPLTNVTVNDDLLQKNSITVTPGPQTIQPGGVVTFTATYKPTQDDINTGNVVNTATATGTPPVGDPVPSNPSTAIVPPDRTPGLTMKKTGTLNDNDGDDLIDLGETISYTFLVTNTGAVTLTNVTVTDPLVTVVEDPVTLAPKGTFTFHGTYTPTQDDINNGNVVNTAHATGTPPSGPPIDSNKDTAVVPPDQQPRLTIDKVGTLNDLDGDNVIDLNETVDYAFTVTNTGTLTMTNVTVNDPKLTSKGLTVVEAPQTLAPGQSFTFHMAPSYKPEQSEIDANLVENTATATGRIPSGASHESDPDKDHVPPDQTPGLFIDKIGKLNDLDGDAKIDLGETISYSFIVRNTGAVTLSNVTVVDTLLASRNVTIDPGPQTLAPGGEVTFTATYTPDQADIDKGDVVNEAKATGTTPSSKPVESNTDIETVPPQQTPELTIEKDGTLNDTDNDDKVGPNETVDYTFTVTNTGTMTMTNVTVDDPKLAAAGLTIVETPQTLAPGQSFTFHLSGSYKPEQAEIDKNAVVNTATATGTTPQGNPYRSEPDTATVPPAQNAGLLIDKIGKLNDKDSDNKIDPDETVSYSFRVTNIGAVTINNVTIDDPKLTAAGVTIVEGPQTLAPGASFVFTATEYKPSQAEIDAGEVENTATAKGVTPGGDPVESNKDMEQVPPDRSAALTISKDGHLNDKDGDNKIDPDETITYTFTVRNTGNVTLVGVTVKDDLLDARGISVTPEPQTLAPGGQVVFTAVYTPTQDDIDGNMVMNTATATGSDPEGNLVESPQDTAQVPPDRTPGLTIEKTGTLQDKDGDGLIDDGEDITYTFLVTNTGNVTLKDVTVEDPLVKVVEQPQTLLPGGTFTFHGSYTPLQKDIDAGDVKNTAHATGKVPSGDTVKSEDDSYTVPPDQTPGLILEKQGTLNDSNGNKLLDLGETISYTFTVTNTGKVTLSNVTIDDPLVTVVEGPQVLGPGGSFVFHGTYTPVQKDIDAGKVLNTAFAQGVTQSNLAVKSDPDSFEVTANITPKLTIVKKGTLNDNDGDNRIDLGETISYSFLVTNTGAVTLDNVTVDDTLLADRGITVTPGPQTLAPGGQVTFTATYTPDQRDVDAGDVVNVAKATGTTPTDTSTESETDTEVVPPDQTPRLTIDKVGTLNDADGDDALDPDETVDYTFKVTNTGTLTMTNVTVSDPKLAAAGLTVVESPQTLRPGQSFTFHLSGSYKPSQAEIDKGEVLNVASATGTTPSGGSYESDKDTEVVPPDPVPGLTIDKTGTLNDLDGDKQIDLGETISYSFVVKNTGAVTINNVTVDDTLLADRGIKVTPGPQTLAPGGQVTFTATYTPDQKDVDAGDVVNVAKATGTAPGGKPVESGTDTATVPPDQTPQLTIDKVGTLNDTDGDKAIDPGETVDYTFKVTNTGTMTMTNVTVSDPKLAAAGLTVVETPQTLAPGQSFTFHLSGSYKPSQAEIDGGKVINVATATAKTPSGASYESEKDTETVPPDQVPALEIRKSAEWQDANSNKFVDAGETIIFTFVVKNTGPVTMAGVTVDDPMLTRNNLTVTPGPQTLAPGAEAIFTATYTAQQADIDSGKVENTATGTGTPPGGGDPIKSPEDTVTVPPNEATSLSIVKSGELKDTNGNKSADAGEEIVYSFLVKNTGAVTMSNVTVNDPMLKRNNLTVTPGPQTLAPGEEVTFTATYTAQQADIDSGRVVNTATGTGTPPGGKQIDSPPSTIEVPPSKETGLTIRKSGELKDANGNKLVDAGEAIVYTFVVKNTGAVTISNVTVNDPMLTRNNLTVTPGPQTLAPGAEAIFTATYTAQQADIDGGKVENTATGTGTPPGGGDPIKSPEDTVTVPPNEATSLSIVKSGELKDTNGNDLADVGEEIVYTFLVKNTGAVTMTDVTVNDPMLKRNNLTVTPGPQTLAPGAEVTFTATYTAKQEDIDGGKVENTATGTGTPPGGKQIDSPPDTVTVPPDTSTELVIEKTATLDDQNGNELIDLGETIHYTFKVTNAGKVTMTGVTVDDPMLTEKGITITPGPQTLQPGASFDFEASYRPTPADIEAGSVINVATATGRMPNGRLLRSLRDEAAIPPAKPSTLEVEKTGKYNDTDGNGFASLGDTITYSFTITNTGDQVITDVSPVDEGPTFNGKPAAGKLSAFEPESVTLEAHGSQVFTATYVLTQEDIDNAAGMPDGMENSATAKGNIVGGGEVPSTSSTSKITIPAAEPSDITIIKQAGLRQIKRGEKAPFSIKVTNHSSANAGFVSVTDLIPPGFRYVDGSATIEYIVNGTSTGPAVPIIPVVTGPRVRFDNVELRPKTEVIIRLRMLALSTAGPGKHTNKAVVNGLDGNPLAPEARADIEIMIEPVFDCGDIVGKVFDDLNRNGYQDEGEPGLPGVRIATVRGSLVTTDKHGRFHVACADLPDQRIGTNFIMKLDPRTLPAGYRVTTENPRVIRLTAGKMSKLNFGASIGRVVRLDLTDAAFETGTTTLKPQWHKGIDRLIEALTSEPSTLRLGYGAAADARLARQRIEAIEEDIAKRWKSVRGRYELNIETRVEAGQ